LVVAARQQITHEWWSTRYRFELFVSEIVLAEAEKGDPSAAEQRISSSEGLPVLLVTPEAEDFASVLVESAAMPLKASVDALHVAIAMMSGMDYLLTWNCRHIANATTRPKIEAICRHHGFDPPSLCTPEELRIEEEL
jgi:hypothetical protein